LIDAKLKRGGNKIAENVTKLNIVNSSSRHSTGSPRMQLGATTWLDSSPT
jgi:hypothetical protein